MARPILLIFDDGRGDFGPLTDLRPALALRSGAVTSRERIEAALGQQAAGLMVAPALADLQREQDPAIAVNPPAISAISRHAVVRDRGGSWRTVRQAPGADVLLVNGRWTTCDHLGAVRDLPVGCALVDAAGDLLAVRLRPAEAQAFCDGGPFRLPKGAAAREVEGTPLLGRPWDLLNRLPDLLAIDLAAHPARRRWRGRQGGVVVEGKHPLRLAAGATVQPGCVFLTARGPVLIDAEALVGACSVLEGPCYVGPGSALAAHTYLRPHTVIGPQCKVAGEVSYSILQGFSNKAHYGYLGHSLVGQWVNLGAGTTVSNLKNTYGSVRVTLRPGEAAQDSRTMFQGPIIGDHVRTAIGSRLLTGSCLGTGTMLAVSSFAPKVTRAFGFYTDDTPDGPPAAIDKFLQTVRAMMVRRGGNLGPAEEARLRALAGA